MKVITDSTHFFPVDALAVVKKRAPVRVRGKMNKKYSCAGKVAVVVGATRVKTPIARAFSPSRV